MRSPGFVLVTELYSKICTINFFLTKAVIFHLYLIGTNLPQMKQNLSGLFIQPRGDMLTLTQNYFSQAFTTCRNDSWLFICTIRFSRFFRKSKNTWGLGGVCPMSMEYVPSDVTVGAAGPFPYPFHSTIQNTPPILIIRIYPIFWIHIEHREIKNRLDFEDWISYIITFKLLILVQRFSGGQYKKREQSRKYTNLNN
jgi:hypothetical protein